MEKWEELVDKRAEINRKLYELYLKETHLTKKRIEPFLFSAEYVPPPVPQEVLFHEACA